MGIQKVETQFYTHPEPVTLDHGRVLSSVTVAYETYGRLNEAKDNVILVFHALSGNQHLAGENRSVPGVESLWCEELYEGWWDGFVGPGKALDTDQFFVICANYLGGCYGSTGPMSIEPETGKPYGSRFPSVTIADMVDSQVRLLDHLKIGKVHALVGASVGGLLTAAFAARYPERTNLVVSISSGSAVTSLTRIYNLEQMYAIEQDAHFNGGDYYGGDHPDSGLRLARMIAHKNYVSLEMMEKRARSEVVQPDDGFDFYKLKDPIESYMMHQGKKFVERFDANTYLRIVDAWQMFDFQRDAGGGSFEDILGRCGHQKHLVISVDSDVCFYPGAQRRHVQFMKKYGVPCRHLTIHSEKGHDAFLLEPELFEASISHVLAGNWAG